MRSSWTSLSSQQYPALLALHCSNGRCWLQKCLPMLAAAASASLDHGLPPLQEGHCFTAALCAHSGAGSAVRLQLHSTQVGHFGRSALQSMLLAGGCLMILVTMTMGELVSAFPMSELACTALSAPLLHDLACCTPCVSTILVCLLRSQLYFLLSRRAVPRTLNGAC